MPFVEQEEAYKDEIVEGKKVKVYKPRVCLLYTSPSPRD